MKDAEFTQCLGNIQNEINKRLSKKGNEYSEVDDRLINFKLGATFLGLTPEYYCRALQTKHIISINGIADKLNKGIDIDEAMIWEKCIDEICYSILLMMLILEKINNK